MGVSVCPECGGAPVDGRGCQDLLHALLDQTGVAGAAAYGLAVACYTLQHPARPAEQALRWAHLYLTAALGAAGGPLSDPLDLDEAQRAARARFDARPEPLPSPALRAALTGWRWRLRLPDLCVPGAGSACQEALGVLDWARAIGADLEDGRDRKHGRW